MHDLTCDNCRRRIAPESDFCPHCGVLMRPGADLTCFLHTDHAASGVCIICGSLVCPLCVAVKKKRRFCPHHANVIVEGDWSEVFRSTDINEAELVKSVLEMGGFHVEVQNFGAVGYVWDGGGDSALSRAALSKPARVFLPISEFLDGVSFLRSWESSVNNQNEANRIEGEVHEDS